MDWYVDTTGVQELVAPMKREESDGLHQSSLENWMQFENHILWSSPEKYLLLNNKTSPTEMDHHQSSSSSVSCGDSLQLDNLEGMDYLSYLFEDLPLAGVSKDDVLWTNNTMFGSQSIAKNISHGLSSSKYLKTHAFSPTLALDYWDKKDDVSSSHFVQFNMGLKDCPAIKPPTGNVTVSPSEQRRDEISVEESVLLELRTVMDQMTANTRLRFRDALYRLARNSNGSDILHIHNQAIRSRTAETHESETNTIDRAIANLMFISQKSSSNDQKTAHVTLPVIISGDAEVPIFPPAI